MAEQLPENDHTPMCPHIYSLRFDCPGCADRIAFIQQHPILSRRPEVVEATRRHGLVTPPAKGADDA